MTLEVSRNTSTTNMVNSAFIPVIIHTVRFDCLDVSIKYDKRGSNEKIRISKPTPTSIPSPCWGSIDPSGTVEKQYRAVEKSTTPQTALNVLATLKLFCFIRISLVEDDILLFESSNDLML